MTTLTVYVGTKISDTVAIVIAYPRAMLTGVDQLHICNCNQQIDQVLVYYCNPQPL